MLFCWFGRLIILLMDHLAKELGVGSQQLSVFGLRSTNATVLHFLSPGRKTGVLQRPGLKSSWLHGYRCSHAETKLELISFLKKGRCLTFVSLCPHGSPSVKKTLLRPSEGFTALTDCSSIMQKAPDHYTSPCVRSVEQRLLYKCADVQGKLSGHAVNRMLQRDWIGLPFQHTHNPVNIHKAFPLLVNIS